MTVYYRAPETLAAGARTLPGRYYTSQEIYETELERIFYERWICAGRAAEIPNAGDYVTRQIGAESVLLLRDQGGAIRAFYNVCRHRGSRLRKEEKGKFPNCIQCPYHAWTYSLHGDLIGAPLMDEVGDFDKADYPLVAVASAEWEGFLFVNLSPEAEPFESAFSPLIGKFNRWNIAALNALRSQVYDVQANWKLIVQNYSECYHCPLVHPDLARKSPYRSGRNDLFEGPFLGGFMELNDEFGSLTMSGRACAAPLGSLSGEHLDRVYYYSIFPSTLLSLHPDYVMVHTLWPRSVGRTQITCEWLFSGEALGTPGFNARDAIDFWDMTNRQDWAMCEISQLGAASRAYSPAPYSGAESLLAAFDRELRRALDHGTE